MDIEIKDRLEKICFCKAITVATVKNSIRQGNDTLDKVTEATGATTGGCRGGRCKGKIQDLIDGYKQGEWQ